MEKLQTPTDSSTLPDLSEIIILAAEKSHDHPTKILVGRIKDGIADEKDLEILATRVGKQIQI